MSIIQHLSQNITPKLRSMLSADINIDSILEQYYAILGTRLSDSRLLSQLTTLVNSTATTSTTTKTLSFEQVWDDANHRHMITEELAETHHLHENIVAQILVVVTPMIYQEIQAQSYTGMMPIGEYLREHVEEMRGYLPTWVARVIPIEVLSPNSSKANTSKASTSKTNATTESSNTNKTTISPVDYRDGSNTTNTTNSANNEHSPDQEMSHNDDSETIESEMTENEMTDNESLRDGTQSTQSSKYPSAKSTGLSKFITIGLPIIAVAAISAGCWLWFGKKDIQIPFSQDGSGQSLISLSKAPIAPRVQPAVVRITSNANGGLFACFSSIGNGTLQSQVISDISNEFGNMMTNSCIFNIVGGQAGYETTLPALKLLPEMLAIIQSVPFASVEFTGDEIRLNAPDKDLLDELVIDAKMLAPDLQVSIQALPVNYAQQSMYTARNALSVLTPDSPPQSIAQALSLASFEFSDGNEQNVKVSGDSQEILNEAASLLKKSPDMLLLIMAHTNNTVSSDAAKFRANAIKQYLVSQGVADSQLITNGLSDQYPIADNETALGRVLNSRIEFMGYSLSAQAGNPINKFGYYQGIATLTDRYQAGSSINALQGIGKPHSNAENLAMTANQLNAKNKSKPKNVPAKKPKVNNQPVKKSTLPQPSFRVENGEIVESYSDIPNNDVGINQDFSNQGFPNQGMPNTMPEQFDNYQNERGGREPDYYAQQGLSQGQLLAEEANRQNQYRQPDNESYIKAYREPLIETPVEEESAERDMSSAPPEEDFSSTPSVDSAEMEELKRLSDTRIVAEPLNGGTMVDNDY